MGLELWTFLYCDLELQSCHCLRNGMSFSFLVSSSSLCSFFTLVLPLCFYSVLSLCVSLPPHTYSALVLGTLLCSTLRTPPTRSAILLRHSTDAVDSKDRGSGYLLCQDAWPRLHKKGCVLHQFLWGLEKGGESDTCTVGIYVDK